MKAPYDDLNFVRELSKYKWCRANLTVIKRFLLPDWSVYGKISVKSRKIGKRNTLKRNTQKKKKKGYETEKNLNMESDQPEIKVIAPLHEIPPPPTTENIMKTLNNDKEPDENKMVTETDFGKDERDEAGPPGKADMEAPKVFAPLHEMPPLPTTESIMKTLNNDKEPNENKTETATLYLMSDFGKDAKENGNEVADLGQDTRQDIKDETETETETETEKKDAKTEENKMKDDDDEVQHDTLELRAFNETFSPVADLGQTKNETEKNEGDPGPRENKKNIEVSEGIRDQGGGGVEGR